MASDSLAAQAAITTSPGRRIALRFVMVIGILSLFADFTYEGARSVLGPYFALLGATATIIGFVSGAGELLGYGLRLVSGRLADDTRQFWPIIIVGYVLQMSVVPLLALTTRWEWAALLVILERVGKAIRNPPRDVLLSHAAKQAGGFGLAFGIHEALDQFGAMLGPLAVAAVLGWKGSYHLAFAALAIPAAINLALVLLARVLYPQPHMDVVSNRLDAERRLPGHFWIYLAGAGLVAVGFADYPLLAYQFSRSGSVPKDWIPLFYAIAMGVSGTGALVLGRLFDRYGFRLLIGLTIATLLYAPLALMGGFWTALVGTALWGLGMGVHEALIPAAVAPMVPESRRASAFGLFTAAYGMAWFAGSAVIGVLIDRSLTTAVIFCVVSEIAALPLLVATARRVPS